LMEFVGWLSLAREEVGQSIYLTSSHSIRIDATDQCAFTIAHIRDIIAVKQYQV
jgi:hypothetical protein